MNEVSWDEAKNFRDLDQKLREANLRLNDLEAELEDERIWAAKFRWQAQELERKIQAIKDNTPPDGWLHFGTLAGMGVPVVFSEELGEDMLPKWEQPDTALLKKWEEDMGEAIALLEQVHFIQANGDNAPGSEGFTLQSIKVEDFLRGIDD